MRFREGISVSTELDGRDLPVSPRYQRKEPRVDPLGSFVWWKRLVRIWEEDR